MTKMAMVVLALPVGKEHRFCNAAQCHAFPWMTDICGKLCGLPAVSIFIFWNMLRRKSLPKIYFGFSPFSKNHNLAHSIYLIFVSCFSVGKLYKINNVYTCFNCLMSNQQNLPRSPSGTIWAFWLEWTRSVCPRGKWSMLNVNPF